MQTAQSWNPAAERSTGRRGRRAEPATLVAVGVITALGAVAAVLSDGAPTSWAPADAAWRALLVVLAALAGSRARRWSLAWGAAVAVAATGGWFVLGAVAALVVAVAMLVLRFRHRAVGAASGAVIALCALRFARPEWDRTTALVAAMAVVPLMVSGYRRSRSSTRRNVRRGAAAVAALMVVAGVGTAVFALGQRTAIDAAVQQTRAAVDALATDDTAAASAGFERAAAQFSEIEDAADAPWLLPARMAPAIGSNLEVARTAARVGAELNLVADELSEVVDQEALRAPDGGIDVAVLAGMREPVARAVGQITSAQESLAAVESPWVVGPLREGIDELNDELDSAADSAELAEMAVERTPVLLGADGPRRYLMLLGNPAEARDLGGHIGNWAEIRVSDGRFEVTEIGSPYELSTPTQDPPLTVTAGAYPQSLVELRPQYHPQNWGGTPDFPSVARLAADLFPQARPGPPLDGVIYADPSAFAALLHFTGPVAVPGTELTLDPDTAAAFLTKGQFEVFGTERDGDEAVSTLIEDTLERFTSARLPSPQRLGEILGPLVTEGRLQFASLHDEDHPLLERIGLLGAVVRPEGGDLLAVTTRNTNPSKIDVYLDRRVEYLVSWNPSTGLVEATLRVSLTNRSPATGLPRVVANPIPTLEPGTNRTTLSVLSPSRVRSATLDGEPTGVGNQQELPGIRRHSVLVDLPPGSTRVVELQLSGELARGEDYRLQWIGQPLVNPGTVEVGVSTDGTDPDSTPSSRTFSLDGAEDQLVTVSGRST